MNKFVAIKPFKEFEKVAYYTFHIEGEDDTEADKFFNRLVKEVDYRDDLVGIYDWLVEIGEKRGAIPKFFRFEDSAEALPPPSHLSMGLPANNLRLYCVILANGGIKTAQKVQDCPDLMPKFRFVKQMATSITEMIRDKEFRFSGKTIFDLQNIEIELK